MNMMQFALSALNGNNRGIRDVLNNDRWVGAIDSIGDLTALIDNVFVIVISIVAMFIIGSAFLKNVMAGAYVAYPKLWDKVNIAHENLRLNKSIIANSRDLVMGNAQWGGSARFQGENSQQIEGTISLFFLRLIPDIKSMTVFEGDNIQAKDYFIRAIPQMIFIVFIGIFIYNGYYRDITMVAGDFGSTMFERYIMQADPVGTFDKLMGMTERPDFSSDLGNDQKQKTQSAISREVYSKVIQVYDDITGKDVKNALASDIEATVLEFLNQDDAAGKALADNHSFFDESKFDVKFSVTRQAGILEEVPAPEPTIKDGIHEYYFYHVINDVKETYGFDSLKEPGEKYGIRINMRYTRKVEKSMRSPRDNALRLTLSTSAESLAAGADKVIGSVGWNMTASSELTLSQGSSKVTLVVTPAGGTPTMVVKNTGTLPVTLTGEWKVDNSSGLRYTDNNNQVHHVATVTFSTDATQLSNSGGYAVQPGASPVAGSEPASNSETPVVPEE